ncbi:STAS domain-containing protein [Actinomadura gamaensis]|uniref:STAS domain-containing protein n=1 Tax=Actinomadura gamaensis TaxID=1763541 RepID=A0ABV9TXZ6_9ACTN
MSVADGVVPGADDPADAPGGPSPSLNGRAGKRDLRLEPLAGKVGLVVSGEIDIRNRPVWQSALDRLAGAGRQVHLELAGLRMIDAGGVGVLLTAASRLDADGGIVLYDPPRALCRILGVLWPDAVGIEVRER